MANRTADGHHRRTRHLPHWEEPGATYLLTFCVKRGVPVDLTHPGPGRIVVDALRHFDGERYWLYDYTVMPNHVHAILKPVPADGKMEPLWRITQSLKKWTARRINRALGRNGALWQDETYDRIIRDEREYVIRSEYILQNAHTSGLIDDPTQWPWWGRGSGP
ncbi:MAG TPA: transposase [Armatimonadota bacterium]|nr:transposase [Armatimonadota bacterium]